MTLTCLTLKPHYREMFMATAAFEAWHPLPFTKVSALKYPRPG